MRGCRFAGNGSPLKDLNGRKKVAFTHLHVHTEYSLLDASSKIKELTARAKELGSDFIVMGRPITAAEDPVEAYRRAMREFA